MVAWKQLKIIYILRCIIMQRLHNAIRLHSKHERCLYHNDLHIPAGCSMMIGDDETRCPGILQCMFGLDTGVLKLTLCSGRL